MWHRSMLFLPLLPCFELQGRPVSGPVLIFERLLMRFLSSYFNVKANSPGKAEASVVISVLARGQSLVIGNNGIYSMYG